MWYVHWYFIISHSAIAVFLAAGRRMGSLYLPQIPPSTATGCGGVQVTHPSAKHGHTRCHQNLALWLVWQSHTQVRVWSQACIKFCMCQLDHIQAHMWRMPPLPHVPPSHVTNVHLGWGGQGEQLEWSRGKTWASQLGLLSQFSSQLRLVSGSQPCVPGWIFLCCQQWYMLYVWCPLALACIQYQHVLHGSLFLTSLQHSARARATADIKFFPPPSSAASPPAPRMYVPTPWGPYHSGGQPSYCS